MRVLLRLHVLWTGLIVATTGALLAVEACWALARPESGTLLVPWRVRPDRLTGISWSQPLVLVCAAALGTVGILLLVSAGLARRHDVPMTAPAEEITVVTSPHSLARLVGHLVRAQDGVKSASVTANARRVRVRASSTWQSDDQLRPVLLHTVNHLVRDLPLIRQPRVEVVVKAAKDRR